MSRDITFDMSGLIALAADLTNAATVIGTSSARAVNSLATEVRKESVQRVIGSVNLAESYVDPKVVVSQAATAQKPAAVLEVPIRGVLLTNFGSRQQVKSNVWTAAKYAATFGSIAAPARLPGKVSNGGKGGKWAPWIPRTGDSLRGIPQGLKQAGIKAGIRPGSSNKLWSHVFFMAGQGGNVVTMSRPKGGGKERAIYGPSVDQIVNNVWADEADNITARLGDSVLENVTLDIQKELKV